MRSWMKWMTGLVAMTVLSSGASVFAQAQTSGEKGSISGVVMKDGQPLANMRVALVKPPPRPEGAPGDRPQRPGRGQGQGAQGLIGPGEDVPPAGERPRRDREGPGGPRPDRPRPQPIAETTTDANGKFTFSDVPAGVYMVVSGERGVGMGRARAVVTAGKTVSVEIVVQQGPRAGEDNADRPRRGPQDGQGPDGERPRRPRGERN